MNHRHSMLRVCHDDALACDAFVFGSSESRVCVYGRGLNRFGTVVALFFLSAIKAGKEAAMVMDASGPVPLVIIDGEVCSDLDQMGGGGYWQHQRFFVAGDAARWLLRSGLRLAVHQVCDLEDSLAFLGTVKGHWRNVSVMVTHQGDERDEAALRGRGVGGCFQIPAEIEDLKRVLDQAIAFGRGAAVSDPWAGAHRSEDGELS